MGARALCGPIVDLSMVLGAFNKLEVDDIIIVGAEVYYWKSIGCLVST